jgi:HD-GYP domain-containing protein (c-di-GMP phosphodiesterase class II)
MFKLGKYSSLEGFWIQLVTGCGWVCDTIGDTTSLLSTEMNTVHDVFSRLEQLNKIGASLSKERDIDSLLDGILMAAMALTRADGGTLYLRSDDGKLLNFAIMRNQSLGIALGGTSGQPIDVPPLCLQLANGQANDKLVAVWTVFNDNTVNIADASQQTDSGFDFSGPRDFDRRTGYKSRSFLTVPMKDHEGQIIGVLQLINAMALPSKAPVAFSQADQSLAESLASQAAIALTKRRLILQQEALFESFINVINTAIDEKSPYTGGHCQRVPELTMMLAEATTACQEGPLAGFKMSEKDRYELKIAGLLHDCGKITTPVHVVDKATKLQTLFDRIELIETRYEVFKRDVEIAALRQAMACRQSNDLQGEQQAMVNCATELDQLTQEFDFLRRCNTGSEAMTAEDQDKIRRISETRLWRNHAHETRPALSADEVENLTIKAGTLTAKERQEINHHIVATIRMLEALPWPRHLANVPEYAGGHHERMDGKGYPKGLRGADMSLQARMMAIADIFEALTASDRPYKQGMSLSRSLNILADFARNGHIDPDLFEVFVKSRVYRGYGEKFLSASQIDEVDESQVLAKAHH